MPKDKETSLIVTSLTNTFWKVRTGLASFWDDEIVSKTFKDYNPEAVRRAKLENKGKKAEDLIA